MSVKHKKLTEQNENRNLAEIIYRKINEGHAHVSSVLRRNIFNASNKQFDDMEIVPVLLGEKRKQEAALVRL